METQEEVRMGIAHLAQKYERASLLTLSAHRNNPSTVLEPWKRFEVWLARQNGGNVPEHVVVHSHTPHGHLFLHVLVAMSWIADRRAITNAAMDAGFGPVNDVRGLKAVDGGYVWAGKKLYGTPNLTLADHFNDFIPGVV